VAKKILKAKPCVLKTKLSLGPPKPEEKKICSKTLDFCDVKNIFALRKNFADITTKKVVNFLADENFQPHPAKSKIMATPLPLNQKKLGTVLECYILHAKVSNLNPYYHLFKMLHSM
jgi:hypothetical protein